MAPSARSRSCAWRALTMSSPALRSTPPDSTRSRMSSSSSLTPAPVAAETIRRLDAGRQGFRQARMTRAEVALVQDDHAAAGRQGFERFARFRVGRTRRRRARRAPGLARRTRVARLRDRRRFEFVAGRAAGPPYPRGAASSAAERRRGLDRVARGARVRRDDGAAPPEDGVEQAGFPRVGRAEEHGAREGPARAGPRLVGGDEIGQLGADRRQPRRDFLVRDARHVLVGEIERGLHRRGQFDERAPDGADAPAQAAAEDVERGAVFRLAARVDERLRPTRPGPGQCGR